MNDIITEYISIDENDIDMAQIRRGAEVIVRGGLVAFPTETVYGLGASALDENAAARIYEAKGRPSDNPLIVHIADAGEMDNIAGEVPSEARLLAERFWPGPLTMILPRGESIPRTVTGGLDTVAIRCPDNKIARALIRESGCPIAAPSANRSGRPSTTRFSHVREDLDGRVDMIIDGGDSCIGLESTIIDLTGNGYSILRPGYITAEELEEVLGQKTGGPDSADDAAPKAPGMKYRHYSPKGELVLVTGATVSDVVRYINIHARKACNEGRTAGVAAVSDTRERYRCGTVLDIGRRNDDSSIAASLYDVLRQFDSLGADIIFVEYTFGGRLSEALDNRLMKAAAGKVVKAPPPVHSSKRKNVIFVDSHGDTRSVMASVLFSRLYEGNDIFVSCRGIVVQFPEPVNQKTEAVMVSNGLSAAGYSSMQLLDSEITPNTLIVAMEERQRRQIISKFASANEDNTVVLSRFVGDELEIMDPYGGNLQAYGICFEVIRSSVQKMADIILEEAQQEVADG